MTTKEQLITEMWKQESLPSGTRLIELDMKREDQGLTPEEEIEYILVKEENHKLLKQWLNEMR